MPEIECAASLSPAPLSTVYTPPSTSHVFLSFATSATSLFKLPSWYNHFAPNHFAFFRPSCLNTPMRLTDKERVAIKDEVVSCFGASTRAVLFGSRVDDRKRGGDIDLLIQPRHRLGDTFQRKVRFLVHLKSRIGDQHIDVVVASPDDKRPIVRIAETEGVLL